MVGMDKTMSEWKAGKLRSGSKHGPVVKSQAQAVAIGLSEQRKEGHPVKKHHSFASSDAPHGAASMGKPEHHEQPVGHKVKGSERKNDGAGRHGADESGHRAYSEHKAPRHPEGSHAPVNHAPGAFGYPGKTMEIQAGDKDHALVGGNYNQSMHEPAVLKTPDGQGFTAGHPGINHASMGSKSHGYGHQQHQRDGVHRLSGAPNAHRIGKR